MTHAAGGDFGSSHVNKPHSLPCIHSHDSHNLIQMFNTWPCLSVANSNRRAAAAAAAASLHSTLLVTCPQDSVSVVPDWQRGLLQQGGAMVQGQARVQGGQPEQIMLAAHCKALLTSVCYSH